MNQDDSLNRAPAAAVDLPYQPRTASRWTGGVASRPATGIREANRLVGNEHRPVLTMMRQPVHQGLSLQGQIHEDEEFRRHKSRKKLREAPSEVPDSVTEAEPLTSHPCLNRG